jgi:hypothetical protein
MQGSCSVSRSDLAQVGARSGLGEAHKGLQLARGDGNAAL